MSPVRETKGRRGKCIFYGSLPQETGGLTPMRSVTVLVRTYPTKTVLVLEKLEGTSTV